MQVILQRGMQQGMQRASPIMQRGMQSMQSNATRNANELQ
jgi:hypothetical protein